MKTLNSFKKKFDKKLYLYLDLKEQEMNKLDLKGGEMIKSIKSFLQYGGKRFRPALFYFAYEDFAKKKEIDGLRFSFIFELFHTFALIHDDIIDHAHVRRGNPTIHTKYGLPMGILSGDFALTLVDELYLQFVSQSHLTQTQIQKINTLFNTYKQELLVGQYLDCIHSEDREKIMKLKTADYSFVKPVLLALTLTGQTDISIKKWGIFFAQLGIVFQLKDDYLGIFADEQATGKSSLSDTQEGKNTQAVELFRKRAGREEIIHFNSFFGKSTFSTSELDWYKNVLEKKNIKQDIIREIQTICSDLHNELKIMKGKNTQFHTLITEIITHINTF